MTTCEGCKWVDVNWKQYSQLPTCTHPEAGRHTKDGRAIWTLYSVDGLGGHCTEDRLHYERKEQCQK